MSNFDILNQCNKSWNLYSTLVVIFVVVFVCVVVVHVVVVVDLLFSSSSLYSLSSESKLRVDHQSR